MFFDSLNLDSCDMYAAAQIVVFTCYGLHTACQTTSHGFSVPFIKPMHERMEFSTISLTAWSV